MNRPRRSATHPRVFYGEQDDVSNSSDSSTDEDDSEGELICNVIKTRPRCPLQRAQVESEYLRVIFFKTTSNIYEYRRRASYTHSNGHSQEPITTALSNRYRVDGMLASWFYRNKVAGLILCCRRRSLSFILRLY